jgi:hypothetical protein
MSGEQARMAGRVRMAGKVRMAGRLRPLLDMKNLYKTYILCYIMYNYL